MSDTQPKPQPDGSTLIPILVQIAEQMEFYFSDGHIRSSSYFQNLLKKSENQQSSFL